MSTVHLHIHGVVAEIQLDNPAKLNAFTVPMMEALESHVAELERNRNVRAVVITAAEAKAFCAGADIIAWGELNAGDFARHWVREGHRVFDRLARLTQPTIAALGAHAFGGGLEFAALADARVMAPRATISLPEPSVGIVPGWSGTQRLIRLIGEPAAKEMALFGRRIGAERAVALGFAVEVAEDPRAVAFAMAEHTATLSPRATEIAKHMIHAAQGEDAPAMVEALGAAAISATEDRNEGVAAFAEKRKPMFTGR